MNKNPHTEMKSSAETIEKVKALTDKLEAGVKEVFESERYKTYLKAMSKFHQYSFGNVLLKLMDTRPGRA